jgi:hypothetical protein
VTGPGPLADRDDLTGDDPDEDTPLDEAEAAAGSAEAEGDTDETLDERIGTVIEDLERVTRVPDGELDLLLVDGRVFAVMGADMLEVALAGPVANAALSTPDTRPSPRGAGWVAFAPAQPDRFALDRAEAWVRLAHRRAIGS